MAVEANQGTSNTTSNKSPNVPKLCNHFNKGTCKYRDRCKFIHDHRGRACLNAKNNCGMQSSLVRQYDVPPVASIGHTGIVKLIDLLSFNALFISPILKKLSHALQDPHWRNAMYDEYNVLVKNGTWLLVSRPACVNMVRSMWLFNHKFHADGTLSRYKACLVANGSSQQLGDDFDETFSPIVKKIIASLHNEFDMTDLGAFNYFLGISADHTSTGLFLSPKKHALQLLERAHMVNYNPSRTRVDKESKLGPECVPGFPSTRSYCVFLGDNLLSWSTKRQHTLSRSSTEAEYCGVANVVAEAAWLRNLLRELHSPLSTATIIYCDTIGVVYMSANLVQHQRTKHIEIDIHFVYDIVTAG
nr:ribonuclease H-like domain-containing protein [Tanacetum cinerariifolium]